MSARDKTDWLEKFVDGMASVLVHGLDAVSAVQEIKRLRTENSQLRGDSGDSVALFMQDGLIARVATELGERGQRGVAKYGVSMDEAKLSRKQWLQHAKEEAMDQVLYLQKLIELEDAAPELVTLPVHDMGVGK